MRKFSTGWATTKALKKKSLKKTTTTKMTSDITQKKGSRERERERERRGKGEIFSHKKHNKYF